MRSRVDGLSKEAFVNRYRDPILTLDRSAEAIALLRDSLPNYHSGLLRAWNNMAFAHLMRSEADEAWDCLDSVFDFEPSCPNRDIERTIASLSAARLLQREGHIAESFELLNTVAASKTLASRRGDLLSNYAKTEYYITSLTLNYHYRDGKASDVRQLLNEAENSRGHLPCDFAQDMALNYALAYCYTYLGFDSADLARAEAYCMDNLSLLYDNPTAYSPFDEANTLQILAHAYSRMGLDTARVAPLYRYAADLFWGYADPYQMLGATVATARYALTNADTTAAHAALSRWLECCGDIYGAQAPKFEARLYDLLLRSQYPASAEQRLEWYDRELYLQELIADSREADFEVQRQLSEAVRQGVASRRFATILLLLAVALVVVIVFLFRQTKRLNRETHHLQEANQRDVARIANVETCLSVMRHDMGPFVNYLQNPKLSPELRAEVLQQLVRTFDNLKRWTNLSLPTGLAFSATVFDIGEVMALVVADAPRPHPEVSLSARPTTLKVEADRELVAIMLRNLVANALQHTVQGSVEVFATPYGPDQRFAEVTVADTGEGMDDETLDALFRADKPAPRPDGSSGFGLILCRHIIKKHDDLTLRGCKIWAESELGRGTSFHFLLKQVEL